MGLDGISVKIIKAGESALSGPLTYIFNLSISTREVPDIWKHKLVSPIHKSGSKLKITHYRPLSVQCITLKLLEQIIQEQLYNFLSEKGVINSKQSLFRRSYSKSLKIPRPLSCHICFSMKKKDLRLQDNRITITFSSVPWILLDLYTICQKFVGLLGD